MNFLLKEHDSKKGKIISICDEELLGKSFEENNFILDINENFFGGSVINIEQIKEKLEISITANIVGNNIIDELIQLEIIEKNNIKQISGVKYAQIFKL